MNEVESPTREARDVLTRCLHDYLLGPIGKSDEEISAGVWGETVDGVKERTTQRPDELYHVGILYPVDTEIDGEEDDSDLDNADSENSAPDSVMALANAMRQSAMGLSFRIGKQHINLIFEASWAEYELVRTNRAARGKKKTATNVELAEADKPKESASETEEDSDKDVQKVIWKELSWKRRPVAVSISLSAEDIDGELKPKTVESVDGIDIVAMKHSSASGVAVTVSLVNRRKSNRPIHQPKITIHEKLGKNVFLPVASSHKFGSEEFWAYELLFRDAKRFAVGHGCSTDWETGLDGMIANRVETEWLPLQEVWKASSLIESITDTEILKLASLDGSRFSREEVVNRLKSIASAYDNWIAENEYKLAGIVASEPEYRAEKLRLAGEKNLSFCREQSARILNGINFLRDNNDAWKAFCSANKAMRLSMERDRPNLTASWFPFQIAFILITLPSVADPNHVERKTLDLIWFPTGGGKTEAYLGLAAWTIFHRRLAHRLRGFGTAVLTRYTLRFLTSQQFERAAKVILSCELLRRQSQDFGDEPISIGLYVGGNVTPNSIREAEQLLATANDDEVRGGGKTTLPIGECPWCSASLSPSNQKVIDGRLVTSCSSKECEFASGIPIVVVDDEIYQNPPTFVVGTIDKFALIPWAPQVSSLFGKGRDVVAPDLIIQDELHLISDSLGSLAGLYESVFDIICSGVSAQPKVIGSTATIRRADEQVKALFDRKLLQFPPSGINAKDSFFFREGREVPGRLYLGVHAQGRSPKHTQPLIAGVLLQFSGLIENKKLRDPFHTVILYFNSLRELGGAFVLVEDDVNRYLNALSRGDLLPDGLAKRNVKSPLELSGSIPSELIEQYTRHLNVSLDDDDPDREPEDVVLATNMISVGVDVGRLGVMIVVGQPKTTSEYIQATSRVGRPPGSAGLVVTLYNWSRPRDRSHYENFRGYHQAFYRYVEAQSVTPFSARARDRALHAAVFALARAEIEALRPNNSASRILDSDVEDTVTSLTKTLLERIRRVETDSEDFDKAEQEIKEIINIWRDLAENATEDRPLVWTRIVKQGEEVPPIMARIMIGPDEPNVEFPIQFSMRDVDAAASLVMERVK